MPKFACAIYYQFWPFLGALIYRFPSREIKVIGITGTKGKTTVTHLTCDILEEAGYKVGSISSLRFKVVDKEWKNELKMTMPGRMIIQKILRQSVDAGCDYFVMEVTSEGIKQNRHKLIDFDVAVFTNLTPEHIESHGGFKNYKEAKGELFKKLKSKPRIRRIFDRVQSRPLGSKENKEVKTKAKNEKIFVVNLDDENAGYFLTFTADEKFAYSINPNRSAKPGAFLDFGGAGKILNTKYQKTFRNGILFAVDNIEFNLCLLGEFNIYNALAAICVGLSQGISLETMKKALEKSRGIPGRMEVVIREPLTVIVDYAHTPDSLEKVYKTISESIITNHTSRMICVLGAAGGGRDKWKRPEMGKIAAQRCDEIILTNEDPYGENPDSILDQIESGFSQVQDSKFFADGQIPKYRKILDRRSAIEEALKSAKNGDVVVITGKGAEPWMMTKDGKVPWDDREIVREVIKTSPVHGLAG